MYNVEKYIGKCLRSIMAQSYRNIEIVPVSDASPDRSLAICEEYARVDSRVRPIALLANQGVNAARFAGFRASRGTYIAFVDSDDFLPPKAIEILWQEMERTQADIVAGNSVKFYDRLGFLRKPFRRNKAKELVLPELFDKYFISYFGENTLSAELWGKLFRRGLFEESGIDRKPPLYVRGQDLMTNLLLFPYVKKYVVVEAYVYYYRYGGITAHYSPKTYSAYKEQYEVKKEVIRKYNYPKALPYAKLSICSSLCVNIANMYKAGLPRKEIRGFIEGEVASGFVDEITTDVNLLDWEGFLLLGAKDIEGLMEWGEREGKRRKRLRLMYDCIAPLLRLI